LSTPVKSQQENNVSRFLLLGGTALFMATMATTASAQMMMGKWSSGNASSLEILGGKKVKYCFLDQCTTQKYKGKASGTITFSWGPDHKYSFTKTASGYHGVYNGDKDMTINVK
jgi:hypothetical protein